MISIDKYNKCDANQPEESATFKVVQAVESVLASDKGALWLYQRESDELVRRVPHSSPQPSIATEEGLVRECWSAGE